MGTTTVGVKLDPETRSRLKELGRLRDRSTHWLMKEAIARYIEDEERYEREKAEDAERWESYVETGRVISHEEVKARMDELTSASPKPRSG